MGELCCDPRGMADTAPQGQRAPEPDPAPAAPSAAQVRAQKFNAANMVRSLLPLTVIVLVVVGLVTLRQTPEDPVRTVETASTIQLAAARAGYELLVPQDLSDQWRPTSVRTDAGDAVEDGDPVTLQIGWFSPDDQYAGYVVTDDSGADAVTDVLDDATAEGTSELGGRTWERFTTAREETALRFEGDGVVALVTGSAADGELETLAASVGPYSAG